MNIQRTSILVLALCVSAALPQIAAAATALSKEEIAATADWFDSLAWPDLTGKPYAELMLGTATIGTKTVDGPKIHGFLLSEDEKDYTVLNDGTAVQNGLNSGTSWPFSVQRISKAPPANRPKFKTTCRLIELPAAVDEVLSELHRPREKWEDRLDARQKTSARTAVFFLARCCAKAGRKDLADRLEAELPAMSDSGSAYSGKGTLSFRMGIEQEMAHALMWKAVVDCGEPRVKRPELLALFERIVQDFPASDHLAQARSYAETLRTMVAEDEAHEKAAKPFETMSAAEKVQELIFRLRDQNGHQLEQPGSCDIFADFLEPGKSPAAQLVQMGTAAVPALIEALGDTRLSRSVNYGRDFFFSHTVLTVGDCARDILSRIAGRNFRMVPAVPGPGGKQDRTEAMRAEIMAWWGEIQTGGEKAALIEDVRAGKGNSYGQALRLTALDPAASLGALLEGIHSAKSDEMRSSLVAAIAAVKSGEATAALRLEV